MLETINIIRMNGDQLNLHLTDISSGIVVQSIDGLDPVKATFASSPFSQRDGEYFHASRREARDIKFTLGIEPSFGAGSVRDIRNYLYDFLMPQTNVRLRFRMENGQSYDIWGRVESFESPMFVKEPIANLSVRCFDPDFFETGWQSKRINSTNGSSPNILEYPGSVESGFTLAGNIPRTVNGITLSITTPDEGVRSLVFDYTFQNGDWVTINTNPGKRELLVKRGGTTSSLLYGVTGTAKWPMLFRGRNDIRLIAAGTGFYLDLGWTNKFGGL